MPRRKRDALTWRLYERKPAIITRFVCSEEPLIILSICSIQIVQCRDPMWCIVVVFLSLLLLLLLCQTAGRFSFLFFLWDSAPSTRHMATTRALGGIGPYRERELSVHWHRRLCTRTNIRARDCAKMINTYLHNYLNTARPRDRPLRFEFPHLTLKFQLQNLRIFPCLLLSLF